MNIDLILAFFGLLATILFGILGIIGFKLSFSNKISWHKINKAYKKIESQLLEYGPDVLIGIADGRITGGIIAANLQIDEFYVIDMPIKYENGNRITQIKGKIGNIKDKKVLLFDNHIYTGTNMEEASKYIVKKSPALLKKAVFFKHEVGNASHKVDYYSYKIGGKRKLMPWSYTKLHDNAYLVQLSSDK